jgi:hypothetical protein
MGLNVFWEDENGVQLASWPDYFSHSDYINDWTEYAGTHCLQYIDEYQDTTFNTIQIPTLIRELESLLPKSKDQNAAAKLKSLLEFIRKVDGNIHTYIKFYGD